MTTELDSETPAWRIAVDRAKSRFKYGDTIPKEWLEHEFGVEWPETMSKAEAQRIGWKFFSAMHAFSNAMLETHKMALCSNSRGGWVVVRPGEQHLYAIDILRKGIAKAFDRASEIIDNTRTDLLSPAEAAERVNAQAKIAKIASLARKRLNDPLPAAMLPEGEDEKI